jgi:hypothetical protein
MLSCLSEGRRSWRTAENSAGHDAAVQMIDTSIVRVHLHGASIVDNNHQVWVAREGA